MGGYKSPCLFQGRNFFCKLESASCFLKPPLLSLSSSFWFSWYLLRVALTGVGMDCCWAVHVYSGVSKVYWPLFEGLNRTELTVPLVVWNWAKSIRPQRFLNTGGSQTLKQKCCSWPQKFSWLVRDATLEWGIVHVCVCFVFCFVFSQIFLLIF